MEMKFNFLINCCVTINLVNRKVEIWYNENTKQIAEIIVLLLLTECIYTVLNTINQYRFIPKIMYVLTGIIAITLHLL